MIYVAAKLAVSNLAATAVNTRHRSRISGKPLGRGKPSYVTYLVSYHHRQNKTDSRKSHQPAYCFRIEKHLLHPLFNKLYLTYNHIKLT